MPKQSMIVQANNLNLHEVNKVIPRTSAAVILFFGSCVSILRTRSLALSDIEGQGLLSKSTWPFNTASNMARSLSAVEVRLKIRC